MLFGTCEDGNTIRDDAGARICDFVLFCASVVAWDGVWIGCVAQAVLRGLCCEGTGCVARADWGVLRGVVVVLSGEDLWGACDGLVPKKGASTGSTIVWAWFCSSSACCVLDGGSGSCGGGKVVCVVDSLCIGCCGE